MDSILISIKKLLGLTADYDAFDPDIIMYINSVFMILTQMGIGPSSGYIITGKENVWSEFLSDPVKVEAVKAYIAVKVRLLGFDVPQSSTTLDAMKNTVSEMEWRLHVEHDDEEN